MSNRTKLKITGYLSAVRKLSSIQDSDSDGAIDPSFEKSLIAIPDDGANDGDEEANDLEIGQFMPPVRNLGADGGEADPELDTGSSLSEPAEACPEDDMDGPFAEASFIQLEPETTSCDDEPEDEDSAFSEEIESGKFPALDLESEILDDATVEAQEDASIDANDLDIAWSAQPWCEYRLSRAFVPRASLVGQRNLVIASGDATDTLSLDDFSVVDASAPPGKARFATLVGDNHDQLLVVTVTGQIAVWDRKNGHIDRNETQRFRDVDRAMDLWREPSTGTLWIRLASGELILFRNSSNEFERVRTAGRCLAMGGNDKLLVCLLNQSNRLSLLTADGAGTNTVMLPRDLSELIHAKSIFLATLGQVIAVGARGHGLWLSSDGGTTFRKLAGCRNVTACAIGQYSGRVYAWAALFFELQDRSEMVGIDCRALRIHKLAEYNVVSDSSGPEDDPPERARIDSLLWDANRQRILAAGCFGLTCFVPPQGPHTHS